MNTQDNKRNILENLKKDNPFQVPENYFDSLGSRISNRITANTSTEKQQYISFAMVKSTLVFAGGFAGLALIIYFGVSIFFTKLGVEKNTSQNEIAFLTEYSIISELDESTLIESFSKENSEISDSLHLENNENIINYLVKEDIDISTIIDEL